MGSSEPTVLISRHTCAVFMAMPYRLYFYRFTITLTAPQD